MTCLKTPERIVSEAAFRTEAFSAVCFAPKTTVLFASRSDGTQKRGQDYFEDVGSSRLKNGFELWTKEAIALMEQLPD